MILMGCSGKRVDYVGIKNGELTPCPGSPNCVSSQSVEKNHYVEPLIYISTKDEAYSKLKDVIKNMKYTKIIEENEKYVHVEFISAIFRFVDDVEFYLDDDNKTIHLRSASRTGYYDFGANRKRIELIRKMFTSDGDDLN